MKRSIKILMIIASLLIVSGLTVMAAAFIQVGFDITKISTESEGIRMEKEVNIIGKSLYVEDSIKNIVLTQSADDKAHFAYCNDKFSEYVFQENQSSVTFTKNFIKRRWYEYLSFGFYYTESNVEIRLPKDYKSEITIKTSTGNIEVSGITTDNIITINNTTGKVSVDNSGFSNILTTNTTGRIALNYVKTQNLTVNNTTGGVSLKNVQANLASIKTSTGGIKLTDALFAKANIKATTGGITGNLVGKRDDYTILAYSSTGSVRVGENTTLNGALIEVKTSTGSIKIDCAQ